MDLGDLPNLGKIVQRDGGNILDVWQVPRKASEALRGPRTLVVRETSGQWFGPGSRSMN